MRPPVLPSFSGTTQPLRALVPRSLLRLLRRFETIGATAALPPLSPALNHSTFILTCLSQNRTPSSTLAGSHAHCHTRRVSNSQITSANTSSSTRELKAQKGLLCYHPYTPPGPWKSSSHRVLNSILPSRTLLYNISRSRSNHIHGGLLFAFPLLPEAIYLP
ncbi:hypothetical protein CBS147346_2147 [Aspergillus niger]|nr:hypothetical protein CBS147346_2147 [Aspergillus niger]